ncbi:hypothetical protein HAX54_044464, partial [Datura stramonium]|nr:hypothetical protein [Datura stramonium]
CLRIFDIGVFVDALGMMTIGYLPVSYGKMPMKRRFGLILASGHYPEPSYIGASLIEIGDSPIYCRWNIYYPSSLILIGGSSMVRGYPPALHRCFS